MSEQNEREAQRVRDNQPCPYCGGDRLRANFTGDNGACHAGGIGYPTEREVDLLADVRRLAKDAADVQTKWLAAEARAGRAEATVARVAALADRLDARFLHEDADAIRRVLAGGSDE